MAWPAVNRTYPGLEGLRKNWLDWLEPWATYRSFTVVARIKDGLMSRFTDYGDRDRALEAVGLSE
jgi:hypothetical protein